MVNLLNQRKKFFAEQSARARRNRPMTQTQQRIYMPTYLKHQGSWTFTQLKKLSDKEIKAKYERLVRSIANFVPMGAEVKEVPVTEEPVKEPIAPKQEEIENPIKKLGRQKSMARKRKLGQSTAKDDEEYEKEKEELSLFFIIAFDKHKDDLSALYQLMIDKYQDEIPEGFDLILWGDLTTMFHPNEEDDF
ncbi:hypothetical protein Tco_1165770 [Tanacetum coccineum]